MALAAGTRLGPYGVLGLIGAGGMGEVYRARDTRLERSVAIKVLPPEVASDSERRTRFEREARTISGLNHQHICTLHDVGDRDGVPYLVMEHLEGQTLAERLKKGPLPLDQVLDLGGQIADALSAAHRHGIVHRDLKPANLMVTKAGAKLLDFGLAKLKGHGERAALVVEASTGTEAESLTGCGTILGTLPYMAPEQLEGKPADARTDLWALGTMLYEMVTGKRAFEGTSSVSLIGQIMNAEPPPLASRYLAKVVCPTPAQQIVFQESVRAVDEQVDRLARLEAELLERAPAWRLYPVVQALQALRGVQWLVAITVVAELGDLTRFDSPRQLAAFVGLIPSEYASGSARHQGGIIKAGNGRARRALIEGAWAYRHPAKVSAHIQTRSDHLPKSIQDLGWKAQVRLCKRFRRLTARGKHPNVAVTAIARELIAFMWAIAKEVAVTL